MKKYILIFISSLMMVSCLDTVILPDDRTVDEEFWKSKEDVSSMVNAAYSAMASEDVITRLIIWGDYRSDELLRSSSLSGNIPDALDEIAAISTQTTNMYATWAGFYNVINRCNIVIERAGDVVGTDPNYTQSNYESDRCQMLALRSLCYFYLVRNFRDVPYVETAFMNSSQSTDIPQSSPEFVLGKIIETLEEVASNANCLRSNGESSWRRVGWMTLDGVHALLADVYLWRASVLKNPADYQKCANYCDLVITSKRNQHVRGRNEVEELEYPLIENGNFSNAYTSIFVDQNSEESIFELQTTNNAAVCKYFYKYGSNTSTEGYLKASSIFGSTVTTASAISNTSGSIFMETDLRYYASCFYDPKSDGAYGVRKMISTSATSSKTKQQRAVASDRPYGSFNQNYIIYRLSDVMLMKAEADAQLMQSIPDGTSEEETTKLKEANAPLLEDAFKLVAAVNTRSMYSEDRTEKAMKWDDYKDYSKERMEELVMQERLRELCFEGKRWYDLLRYNYRHIEGVQYDKTFGDIVGSTGTEGSDVALPAIYKNMLDIMTRSRGTDASAIQAKMRNEAYLYMPIPESDINICPLLKQNPAYKSTSAYEKQY